VLQFLAQSHLFINPLNGVRACAHGQISVRKRLRMGPQLYRDSLHYFRFACYEIKGTLYAVDNQNRLPGVQSGAAFRMIAT
jgi:hypothetical protein